MSNIYNNYVNKTPFGPIFKDYQHANRLYVTDSYAKAPKFGFLYFVKFHINGSAIKDPEWEAKDRFNVGLLAKKVDLPKFTIATETINQYNRKTVVQKSINYTSVNIDLHDDNTNITHFLWENYYKHYFVDGQQSKSAFGDTKYRRPDYNYGRYDSSGLAPGRGPAAGMPVADKFFESIEIFVLHQGNFTKYTLVNPKIKDWKHDQVDQSAGNKTLENKLTIEYETVFYNHGKLTKGGDNYMELKYYDQTPGPHTKPTAPVYTRTGIDPFDKPAQSARFKTKRPETGNEYSGYDYPEQPRTYGVINRPRSDDILTQLGKVVLKNYVDQNGLTRQNATAYNIAGSLLAPTMLNGPGKYGAAGPANEYAEPTANAPGVFTLPGGVGINIFKGFNTTVDGNIRANPSAIIFPFRRY